MLVRTRYRYDRENLLRVKTADLIEGSAPWRSDAALNLEKIALDGTQLQDGRRTRDARRRRWRIRSEAVRAMKARSRHPVSSMSSDTSTGGCIYARIDFLKV